MRFGSQMSHTATASSSRAAMPRRRTAAAIDRGAARKGVKSGLPLSLER